MDPKIVTKTLEEIAIISTGIRLDEIDETGIDLVNDPYGETHLIEKKGLQKLLNDNKILNGKQSDTQYTIAQGFNLIGGILSSLIGQDLYLEYNISHNNQIIKIKKEFLTKLILENTNINYIYSDDKTKIEDSIMSTIEYIYTIEESKKEEANSLFEKTLEQIKKISKINSRNEDFENSNIFATWYLTLSEEYIDFINDKYSEDLDKMNEALFERANLIKEYSENPLFIYENLFNIQNTYMIMSEQTTEIEDKIKFLSDLVKFTEIAFDTYEDNELLFYKGRAKLALSTESELTEKYKLINSAIEDFDEYLINLDNYIKNESENENERIGLTSEAWINLQDMGFMIQEPGSQLGPVTEKLLLEKSLSYYQKAYQLIKEKYVENEIKRIQELLK